MKKTLITLLAMSGMVMAAQQSITLSDYGYKDGFYVTTTLDANTITTLLSTASINQTLIGHSVQGAKYKGDIVSENISYSAALGIKTWETRNEMHLFREQKAGESAVNGTMSLAAVEDSGYAWPTAHNFKSHFLVDGKSITGAALTYAFTTIEADVNHYGVAMVMTVSYSDGTTSTVMGQTTGYSWSFSANKGETAASYKATELTYNDTYLKISSEDIIKSGTWTYADLVAHNQSALVPEPATATLSLLALCGLCARRRRK